jgi:hypothetical protein
VGNREIIKITRLFVLNADIQPRWSQSKPSALAAARNTQNGLGSIRAVVGIVINLLWIEVERCLVGKSIGLGLKGLAESAGVFGRPPTASLSTI